MRISGKKDIPGAIAAADKRIDAGAELERARYTHGDTIMQAVYQHKLEEALSFFSGLNIGAFPLLEAEAQARGIPMREMAQKIVDAASAWRYKMADIEGRRIRAKLAIRNLNCVATIQEISQSAFPHNPQTGS